MSSSIRSTPYTSMARRTFRLLSRGLLALAFWLPNLAPASAAISPKPSTTPPTSFTHSSAAAQKQLNQAYGKLPLSFELNQGQTDKQVKFLSRGSGYNLFLTSAEAVLVLAQPQRQPLSKKSLPAKPAVGTVLRMQLAGANPQPHIRGLDELSSKSNYLIGKQASRWHTGVPSYAKVSYQDVYSGVDLVYYGNQQQLEYDFLVDAGVNPKIIRMKFNGVERQHIDAKGALVLQTKAGQVHQPRPHLYQEVEGKRRTVVGMECTLNVRQSSQPS